MDHSHPHCHSHSHHNPFNSHAKKLGWITLLSAFYMVVEFLSGWWSGSLALIADSGHMAVDVAAMGIGLFALWISRKPPTSRKTFGYKRAEALAALLNGTLLLFLSGGILFEAIQRLYLPHQVESRVMFWVGLGGLLINLIGLWVLRSKKEHDLGLRSVTLHLLSDTLGSVASMAASAAIFFWNWTYADSIASLIIGLLMMRAAGGLLYDVLHVLLEGVPKGLELEKIERNMRAIEGVLEVHDLHVWTMAPQTPALSAHIRVEEKTSRDLVLGKLLHSLKENFQIEHATLQLESKGFEHSSENMCFK